MHIAIQIEHETIEIEPSGSGVGIRMGGMSEFFYLSAAEVRLVQAALDAAVDNLREALPGASRV